MRWGDEINIVASLILQGEHYTGQLIIGYLLPVTLVADVEVLAK
jgi:hypothetical protein